MILTLTALFKYSNLGSSWISDLKFFSNVLMTDIYCVGDVDFSRSSDCNRGWNARQSYGQRDSTTFHSEYYTLWLVNQFLTEIGSVIGGSTLASTASVDSDGRRQDSEDDESRGRRKCPV